MHLSLHSVHCNDTTVGMKTIVEFYSFKIYSVTAKTVQIPKCGWKRSFGLSQTEESRWTPHRVLSTSCAAFSLDMNKLIQYLF